MGIGSLLKFFFERLFPPAKTESLRGKAVRANFGIAADS